MLRERTPLTAKDVYDAAAAGDPVALAIVDEIGAELGRALRNVVLAYDAESIVLGGGVTRAGAGYLRPIVAEWARQHATSPLARALLPPGDDPASPIQPATWAPGAPWGWRLMRWAGLPEPAPRSN